MAEPRATSRAREADTRGGVSSDLAKAGARHVVRDLERRVTCHANAAEAGDLHGPQVESLASAHEDALGGRGRRSVLPVTDLVALTDDFGQKCRPGLRRRQRDGRAADCQRLVVIRLVTRQVWFEHRRLLLGKGRALLSMLGVLRAGLGQSCHGRNSLRRGKMRGAILASARAASRPWLRFRMASLRTRPAMTAAGLEVMTRRGTGGGAGW